MVRKIKEREEIARAVSNVAGLRRDAISVAWMHFGSWKVHFYEGKGRSTFKFFGKC